MATLALGLPIRWINRWRIASCLLSERQSVKAALHNAQRRLREPAFVIGRLQRFARSGFRREPTEHLEASLQRLGRDPGPLQS